MGVCIIEGMKILVLFTGGTIGSSLSENYISPNQDAKYKLINMYKDKFGDDIEFVTREPYIILSENLDGVYITRLINSVMEVLNGEECDELGGIIVTHGTDTLQYSAAALSIALGKTDIPVILVSANYPLEDVRSNGINNFIAAVQYILRMKRGGVYVSYQNENGFANIFQASSLLRHDIYSDEIRTLKDTGKNYSGLDTGSGENKAEPISLSKNSPVKMIMTYPGMTFEIPQNGIKKILFVPYHSGTLPTGSPELIEFCKAMREKGVEMYICGVSKGPQYETTRLYKELGINVLGVGTDIYWYMKLWIG